MTMSPQAPPPVDSSRRPTESDLPAGGSSMRPEWQTPQFWVAIASSILTLVMSALAERWLTHPAWPAFLGGFIAVIVIMLVSFGIVLYHRGFFYRK